MKTDNRRTASLIACGVLAVLASAANAQTVRDWDLPEQPLAKSLREIAARSESNIIFDKKLVNDQAAPPLKMKASTEEALAQVLEGTGLTYRHLDDKTVAIQLASADPSTTTSNFRDGDGRIRLAQAQTSQSTATSDGKPQGNAPTVTLLEEIIVTGTNIRGIENNTAPVTTLTREYIDSTGYSSTTQLLNSVTQNLALANENGINTPGVSGNNREQGSSINLRGLGEGTTLVLLNGRRLAPGYRSAAVDISSLPLSAIDRVEILPDGASALYGSDAVGGVVNFILRKDFEGIETRVRGGAADGVDEYRASQAVGNAWDSGNFLASIEFLQRDMLKASDRDFVPSTSLVGSLAPETENYSGILTLQQQLGETVNLFTDVLYSNRDTANEAGRQTLNEATETDNSQGVATLGVDWNFAGDWVAQLSGSYAINELDQVLYNRTTAGLDNNLDRDMEFAIKGGELKLDGSLFTLPGGVARAALGAAWRGETYYDKSVNRRTAAITNSFDTKQNIRSAYGEVYVPLVGKDNAISGVNRLELSLAGRYDEYSTAGSSFDPTAGLMWEPVGGLRLRGRYSTSYKAPNLVEYTYSSNLAQAANTTVNGTAVQALAVTGTDVDGLSPQESESISFGVEIAPIPLPGLDVSVNYYKIEFTDAIATPANGSASTMLANQAAYADLIYFNPSVDLTNQFLAIAALGRGLTTSIPDFTADMIDVIVDARRRNLSIVRAEGVDLGANYRFKVGDSSNLTLGLQGTYVLNQEQQVTDTSPEVDLADTIYNPPSWRARALIGWQLHGFAANLFANHTDSYLDNRSGVTTTTVDSYTTFDTRFAYNFSERFKSGALSGFTLALSAVNVLDEDPPSIQVGSNNTDAGYDPVNADPLGRFISLEITKVW